jgi:cytochrome b561
MIASGEGFARRDLAWEEEFMSREAASYSGLAKGLHWIVAVIVVGLVPVGLVMADLDNGPLKDQLFVLHESFGVAVLALVILRLGNRLRGAPAPAACLSPGERRLSIAVHRALYFLLLATPIVGWLALSAFGLGPAFFGLGHLPALVGRDEPLSKILFAVHKAGGVMIGALVAVHVVGALRHAFVQRDELLWRMVPAWRR